MTSLCAKCGEEFKQKKGSASSLCSTCAELGDDSPARIADVVKAEVEAPKEQVAAAPHRGNGKARLKKAVDKDGNPVEDVKFIPGQGTPWITAERPHTHPLVCPRHLQSFTPEELDMEFYPDAAEGMWCGTCGRPVRKDGRSGKRGMGVGKPCPECGFRRKRGMHPNAVMNLPNVNGRQQEMTPAELSERGRHARRGNKGRPRVSELMEEMAHKEAEKIIKPYLEGLKLEPRDDWSPSTKLAFYSEQTALAEKVFNRVDGMPTQRHRRVDAEDRDIHFDARASVSPGAAAELLAAVVSGAVRGARNGSAEEYGEGWEEAEDAELVYDDDDNEDGGE